MAEGEEKAVEKEPAEESNKEKAVTEKERKDLKNARFAYWPEIAFVLIVLAFVLWLPTFFLLKIILVNICMVMLCMSIYEYWNRRETVNKVKEEKIKILEEEIDKVKKRADEMEEEFRQKLIQKINEKEATERRLSELKEQELAESEKRYFQQKKNKIWSVMAPVIVDFAEKNFETFNNRESAQLMEYIEENVMDKRMIFADTANMDNLRTIFSVLQFDNPLEEVIAEAKLYDDKMMEFRVMLEKDNKGLEKQVVNLLLEEALRGKRYTLFKKKVYNDKPELQFTNDINDYIRAYMAIFPNEALENAEFFIKLLQEDVNKNLNKALVMPLINQEVKRISN